MSFLGETKTNLAHHPFSILILIYPVSSIQALCVYSAKAKGLSKEKKAWVTEQKQTTALWLLNQQIIWHLYMYKQCLAFHPSLTYTMQVVCTFVGVCLCSSTWRPEHLYIQTPAPETLWSPGSQLSSAGQAVLKAKPQRECLSPEQLKKIHKHGSEWHIWNHNVTIGNINSKTEMIPASPVWWSAAFLCFISL